MKPRQIITAHEPIVCEICRRTLLRGETPVPFIADGRKVKVCELCEPRAVHEGWIREGVGDDTQVAVRRRDRKSILRRLRGERRRRAAPAAGLDEHAEGPARRRPRREVAPTHGSPRRPRRADERRAEDRARHRDVQRLRAAAPHGRDHEVARCARRRGPPSATEGVIVRITIAWELAWYRFDVDLGDAEAGVKPVARGSELRELDEAEMQPTNAMDEDGLIVAAA